MWAVAVIKVPSRLVSERAARESQIQEANCAGHPTANYRSALVAITRRTSSGTSRSCAAQRCPGDELLRRGCFALHRKP
jgi:hypothetical protein